MFGYAADRCTEPDWLVLPDGSQTNAWRLLHATSKGGDRFCVGSFSRYTPGQADDAANKAKEYQFESLRKIYFYDAWRWKIELNQPDSLLHLPPRPGLLQNGCYWRPSPTNQVNTTESHNTQASVDLAEASLPATNSEGSDGDGDTPPSEVPEPESRGQEATSPTSAIAVSSSDEGDICSQDNDTEPSEDNPQVETITSMSEGEKALEGATAEIPASQAAIEEARATRQGEQTEGERAEETESGTTDEVIEIEVCEETTTAQATSTVVEAGGSVPARNELHPPSRQLATTPPLPAEINTDMEKTGIKRLASMASLQDEEVHPASQDNTPALTRDGHSSGGGHLCGCPSASSACDSTATPLQEKRKGATDGQQIPRLARQLLLESASSSCPPSPSDQEDLGTAEAFVPQGTAKPRPPGPLAVKSKAAKPAMGEQRGVPEQGLINALHAQLQIPPAAPPGLLSMAPAKPATTGAADPKMPAPYTNDPGTHTPTETAAPTKEIYLQREEQSGPVDTEITLLAEQRAMHMVHRYQTLSVKMSEQEGAQSAEEPEVLPPVAPPISLYADLPQEWPLARLSV